jgi:hypothetical protein
MLIMSKNTRNDLNHRWKCIFYPPGARRLFYPPGARRLPIMLLVLFDVVWGFDFFMKWNFKQRFHQYQQHEHQPLTLIHWTKMTTTYGDGYRCLGLGQAQRGGVVQQVNGQSTPHNLILHLQHQCRFWSCVGVIVQMCMM